MLQKVEIFTCSSNNKVFGSKSIGLRFFQSQDILQGQNDSELVKIIIHYSLFIIHYSLFRGRHRIFAKPLEQANCQICEAKLLAKIAMRPLIWNRFLWSKNCYSQVFLTQNDNKNKKLL